MKNPNPKLVMLAVFMLLSAAIFSRIVGLFPENLFTKITSDSPIQSQAAMPPPLVTCGETYYDQGGPNNNYPNSQAIETTICPDTPGEFVEVEFNSFNTESGVDWLYVYNGVGQNNTIAGYSGNRLPPLLASNEPNGCLTFYFTASSSVNASGWEADVTCTTCPRVNKVKAENISSNSATITYFYPWQFSPAFYEYEVGLAGFVPGTGNAVATGTSTSYNANVQGLIPSTDYEIYMRMQCQNGQYGGFSSPAAFRTAPSCGEYFYDSGGENGDVAILGEPTVTLCPDQPGYYISINFEEFDVNDLGMTIYSGNSGDLFPIGNFDGNRVPTKLSSFSTSGCLTIAPYTLNFGATGTGWKAAIECVACPSVPALNYNNLTGTTVTLEWMLIPPATLYQWEVGPAGFQPGTGTYTSTGVSDNQFGEVTGLTSGTYYDAYVRVSCLTGQFGDWIKTSFTTYPTCGDDFFDAGGPTGDLIPNVIQTTVVCPDVPNTYASVNFESFDIGTSNLTIYDSNTPNGGPQTGPFLGTNSPGVVTATNGTGCLTFFLYATNDPAPGWEASISCVTCPPPSGLLASNPTLNSISLEWTTLSNAQSYFYEIVEVGDLPGTGAAVASGAVASNAIFVSGLASGTVYQAYVKAVCNGGDESNFSNPVNFSTIPTCGDSFYDNGGPTGGVPYQWPPVTTTICPDVLGTYVQVVFSEFGLTNGANFLSVYDGDNTFSGYFTQLAGTVVPPPLTSNHPNGCLTFYHYQSFADTLPGWAAQVTCVTCPTPRNVNATPVTANSLQVGWEPVPIPATYEWEVGPVGFTPGTGTSIQAGATTQTNTVALGLEGGTEYEVYVRAKCTASDRSLFAGPTRVTTYPTCGDVFVDNGGLNGDFLPNLSYGTIICPDQPGQFVQLDFSAFDMGDCCSSLYIHDGQGGPQIGQYFDETSPGVIVANNFTGCLDVFVYSSSTTGPGWVADVTCVSCPFPNLLRVAQMSGENASFTWNQTTSATNYEWELGLPGFTPGNGEHIQSGTTNSNALDITGLDGVTIYELYVRAVCGANGPSTYGGVLQFTTPPTCGDVFTDSGGTGGNYGEFENNMTRICPVNPGLFVALDFTAFDINPSGANLNIYNGFSYLDFNNNNPPSNRIYAYEVGGCLQANFTNSSGLTAAGWEANVTCVTCPPPTNLILAGGGFTFNTVTVAWSGASVTEQYFWELGPVGFTPGTGAALFTGDTPFNTPFVTLTGLEGLTTYDFYVRSDCSNGDFSPYSRRLRFTTAPTCGDYFYDPAGPDSSYNSGYFYPPVTICPDVPGTLVEVSFLSLNIHPWNDNISVHDGIDWNAPIIANFSGSVSPLPGPFTANNPTGCLTFSLNANGGQTWEGWEASINCVTCPAISNLQLLNGTEQMFTWTALATAVNYHWEVGEIGFTPGTGTALRSGVTSTNTLTFNDLEGGVNYEIYVWTECSNGEFSSYGNGIIFTTSPSCGDKFFDSGGPNGDYQTNESTNTIICPEAANQAVTVTFTEFQTESCCDQMTIFSGINGWFLDQLVGTPTLPRSYTSIDPTGCLTFNFYSDGSNVGAGWEADITCSGCVKPSNLTATNIDGNGALLSWNVGGSAASYNYEVGTVGFVPGIGLATVVGNTTDESININTLQAGVEYCAYVRSICDNNEVSEFEGPTCFTTPLSCGVTSYDTGGPNDDYGPNEDYYTLLCPEVPGSLVSLNFSLFETQSCCDKLEILNGIDQSAPSLGLFFGNASPGVVTASNPSGCLTLHFTSDATVQRSGWAAEVNCLPSSLGPDPLKESAIEVSPNPAKDRLNVKLPVGAGGSLQVADVAGRLQWQGSVQAGMAQTTIPLEGLPAGVYFLRWQSEVVRFVVAP